MWFRQANFAWHRSFFPSEYKVPLSFSVHVTNGHGAAVGLKLRVTRFKEDEYSRAREDNCLVNTTIVELLATKAATSCITLDKSQQVRTKVLTLNRSVSRTHQGLSVTY
jgi:hypothetical protein